MDIKIKTEMTPNPHALKFITNITVINHDRLSLTDAEQCKDIPLAASIFALDNVVQVHFYDNVVTVTQNGNSDWGELEAAIKQCLTEQLPSHDPNIDQGSESSEQVASSPELQQINAILDNTIRPALQGDGGDLEVLGLEENRLMIRYQGACGGCPSALMGTLQAIEGILRDQYHPDIEVHAM